MLKYAFIVCMDDIHPESFTAEVCKTDTLTRYYGTSSMEETLDVVRKIKEEGFELINLCSAYDDDMKGQIADLISRTKNVHYSSSEEEKLEKVEDFSRYGVISIDAQLDAIETTVIAGKDFTMTAKIVKDLDMAIEAAVELVHEQVTFIELCSWFDSEKTQSVIDAIHSDIPVGSCGIAS